MLKPDAEDRGLTGAILERLAAAGFVEDARCKVSLRDHCVARLFLHPLPEYIAHLESRPVTVHLLRGVGGPERLFECKWSIRKEFGVTDRLRNLIHGADEGNEHHLFLDAFFPDLPAARYCGAADLDLRFAAGTTSMALSATLAALDRDSALKRVVVTLELTQQHLVAAVRRQRRKLQVTAALLVRPVDHPGTFFQVHLGTALPTFSSGAEREWAMADVVALVASGHEVTLADLPISGSEIDRYAADLRAGTRPIDDALTEYPLLDVLQRYRALGVGSFAAYRPRLDLMTVEFRCDLARMAGMAVTGGSAGLALSGRFSVSAHCAAMLGQPRAIAS